MHLYSLYDIINFIYACSYLHNQDTAHFPQPRQLPCAPLYTVPCPPDPDLDPSPPLICYLLLYLSFPIPWISYEWDLDHIFLYPVYFSQNVFEIRPCHCMCPTLFLLLFSFVKWLRYFFLSIHLLMDFWVVSDLWHCEKQVMVETCFHFSWMELLGCMSVCLILWETAKLFFQRGYNVVHFLPQCLSTGSSRPLLTPGQHF